MPHAWILDVLADLRTYADANDLPAISVAAAQSLEVARLELAAILKASSNPGQD